jgi:hypothetical protein
MQNRAVARIDHVIVGVQSLEVAAERFLDEFGLEAQPGGRHGDAGTANMIVPLGDEQFLELLTIINPASRHPMITWLGPLIDEGDRLVTVAIEVDDLDATAARLDEPAFAVERIGDDGRRVAWRLTGMLSTMTAEVLPFFLEVVDGRQWCTGWREPRHRIEPRGIVGIEFGGDPHGIRDRLADDSIPIAVVSGRPGVLAVTIDTDHGALRLTI